MSEPSPWYRHFWPWFIVVLMVVSVGASLWTVVIAYGLGDLEVSDTRPASVESQSLSPSGPAAP
ncbi:MAG: FixH family protein [bacterium]|nr:FixH family protein [bacterium]